MLSRLKFDIQGLFEEIYNERLPESVFVSDKTTFADLQSAGLQSIVPLVNKLREYGHSDDNIRSRVFAFMENDVYLNYVMVKFPDLPVTIDIYKESIDMKFDVIVGNPPYSRKTNLKFLNKSLEISNIVLFVHPVTWLIDEKNVNGDFNNSRELHKNYLKYVEIINGNEVFGVGLFVPCAITYSDKSGNDGVIKVFDKINNLKTEYSSIYDINKYSNTVEYPSIKTKIYAEKTLQQFYKKERGNFYVNFSRVRGHVNDKSDTKMVNDDFYTTVTKDEVVVGNKTKSVFFSFETEIEANNFLKYLKTKFSRFCLSICKNGSDLNAVDFKYTPWLDFTEEWTDEKLYDKFGLNNEEVGFINSRISDYY